MGANLQEAHCLRQRCGGIRRRCSIPASAKSRFEKDTTPTAGRAPPKIVTGLIKWSTAPRCINDACSIIIETTKFVPRAFTDTRTDVATVIAINHFYD